MNLALKMGYTEEEVETFRREARQIGARLNDATGSAMVDRIERDMKVLQERAAIANYSLPELTLAQEHLITRRATLTATAMVRQTLERDKAVSVDFLQSLSGLPSDRFALLLLDLCKRFGLSISGDKVTLHGDVDIDMFVRDVDGYFARWRENEAFKAGKQMGD